MPDPRTTKIDRVGPNKVGDQYVVIVSALLQYEKKPVKDHPVQFYLDWIPFPSKDSLVNTEEDGRAQIQIPVSEGYHTVAFKAVRSDDGEEWRSETFRVGEFKEPEEKDLELKAARKAADLAELGLKKAKAKAEIGKLKQPVKSRLEKAIEAAQRAKALLDAKRDLRAAHTKPDPELAAAERAKELAEFERDTAQARKAIRESEPTTPIPQRVSVAISGPRGKQKLLISCPTDDGGLIPLCPGIITDGDDILPFKTDPDDRTYLYQADFNSKTCVIEVRVGGAPSQIWKGVLRGPKPAQTP